MSLPITDRGDLKPHPAAARPKAPEPASPRPPMAAPAAAPAVTGATTARGDLLARTLANAVQERAGARAPVLQRLIAVSGAHTDYAIMKQVHQLREGQAAAGAGRDTVVELNAGTDFSVMGPGEDLFIVSHGNVETGDLKPSPTTEALIAWLNKGLPSHIGKIVVLSCYGGVPKHHEGALAKRISAGLKSKLSDIVVEGATGFSFGTPQFSSDLHSSVLSEDLSDFYALKKESIPTMATTWGAMRPTHFAGVLSQPPHNIAYAKGDKTIREHLAARWKTSQEADKQILALITAFQEEASQIEAALKTELSQVGGNDVPSRVLALENLPPTAAWNTLLARQHELFNAYYLWTDPDAAFRAFKGGVQQ